jgi:hypothetical protein
MEFEFTDSLWIEEADLKEMVLLCKNKKYTPQQALNEIASGWDDEQFFKTGLVEEQIIVEIERRLN